MRMVVFAGPSIDRASVESVRGAEFRPPVAQGDVLRAAQTAPDAIAIIDGYFDGVPSVWHKEILWALSQGIAVYGASSMGALRAAELYVFGMQGIGEIFAAFRDGVYEDDDEVAVLHGSAEMNYRALTLPMVNARATLGAARRDGIVNPAEADRLLALAKAMFYQDRTWSGLFRRARLAGVDPGSLDRLEAWLPRGERDLKRADAEALLGTLRRLSPGQPVSPGFEFEWTVMWDRVFSDCPGFDPHLQGQSQDSFDTEVLDELRLRPARYREMAHRVQLKQLALREAERRRLPLDAIELRRQLQLLREANDLYSREQLEQWITQNDWSPARLERALEVSQRSQSALLEVADPAILDELRLCGEYAGLKAAARRKLARNADSGGPAPIKPAQLLSWYFESILGESIPVQLDDYLAGIGIYSREDFYRLLRAHHCDWLAKPDEKQ